MHPNEPKNKALLSVYCINIHKTIETVTETNNRIPSNSFEKFNFYHEEIAWESVKSELSQIDWDNEFYQLKSEEKFEKLLKICEKTAEKFVPIRKPFKETKSKRIPRERRILMRRRSKLEMKFISARNSSQIDKIKTQLFYI